MANLTRMLIREPGLLIAHPLDATVFKPTTIFKPTSGLLVLAWAAVLALIFQERRAEVYNTTPTTRVDNQEALALLVAATTGCVLLTVDVEGRTQP